MSEHDNGRINAGYMVLEPKIFDYIEGDITVFEKEPLQPLAKQGELKSYFHSSFWQCMDTKKEMEMLEQMWENGSAP
jgi:glucose-1-phosphate cytidylyltransferase